MSNSESNSQEEQTEDTQAIGAHALEYLQGILDRMDIKATVEVVNTDEKIMLNIDCEEVERVIGRRGQVVDALQHLVGKMVSQHRVGRGKPVIVDAGDYRARHVERLESLAVRMGEKSIESQKNVDLSPMTAYDRRIVHMALAEVTGVTTRSEGEGERRHVVVVPGEAESNAEPRSG